MVASKLLYGPALSLAALGWTMPQIEIGPRLRVTLRIMSLRFKLATLPPDVRGRVTDLYELNPHMYAVLQLIL